MSTVSQSGFSQINNSRNHAWEFGNVDAVIVVHVLSLKSSTYMVANLTYEDVLQIFFFAVFHR